jgi:hypothetical protein
MRKRMRTRRISKIPCLRAHQGEAEQLSRVNPSAPPPLLLLPPTAVGLDPVGQGGAPSLSRQRIVS